MREDSPKIDLNAGDVGRAAPNTAGDGARDAAVECGDRWSGVAMDVRSRPGSRRGRWCDRRVATTAAEGVLYKQQIRLLTITIPFSVPAAKCFDFEIQDVVVTAPCFAVKLFDHVKVEHI